MKYVYHFKEGGTKQNVFVPIQKCVNTVKYILYSYLAFTYDRSLN